jgi:hypothetical protein
LGTVMMVLTLNAWAGTWADVGGDGCFFIVGRWLAGSPQRWLWPVSRAFGPSDAIREAWALTRKVVRSPTGFFLVIIDFNLLDSAALAWLWPVSRGFWCFGRNSGRLGLTRKVVFSRTGFCLVIS